MTVRRAPALSRRAHNALRIAADRAASAPSVHNTQPWRLDLYQDRLELHVDRTRQLTALDPRGRELVISVGAALLNARVGLAAVRQPASVDRFPDAALPSLAAVLRPVDGAPDPELGALDPLVLLRRSNRDEFAGAPPAEVIDRLRVMAGREGARLFLLDATSRHTLARLGAVARAVQEADAGYDRELADWTSRPAREHDGVTVQPSWSTRAGTGAVPLRDFAPGRNSVPAADDPAEDDEALVVLATDHDTRLEWLRAGEALERVLLEVARLGWQAGVVTQPVEVPATREDLRRLLPGGVHPQAVLRIGRAEPPAGTSPRRRTVDVLRDKTCSPLDRETDVRAARDDAGPGGPGPSGSAGRPPGPRR